MSTAVFAPALLNLGALAVSPSAAPLPQRDAAPGAFARQMAQAQASGARESLPVQAQAPSAAPPSPTPPVPAAPTARAPAPPAARAASVPGEAQAASARAEEATAHDDRVEANGNGNGKDAAPDPGAADGTPSTAPPHRLARGRLPAGRPSSGTPGADAPQLASDGSPADRATGPRGPRDAADDEDALPSGSLAATPAQPLPAPPPAPVGSAPSAGPDGTAPARAGAGPAAAVASDTARAPQLSLPGAADSAADRGEHADRADTVQALPFNLSPAGAPPSGRATTDPAAAVASAPSVSTAAAAGTLSPGFAAVLEQRSAMDVLPPSGTGLPTFAAELARAGQPLPSAAPAPTPAPTELTLPTPVSAPDFLPRLSGELAVLARDGVQEARVNLHPVELGPIAVQIALEGNTAQVHLSVDNARTRELLEQALPMLAASLRDNGLTLTGGGVFQQPRQAPQDRPGADAGRPGRDARSPDSDAPGPVSATAPARPWRRVGGLDVFA